MATEKQIEANRRNAAKGTGPNTAQGKESVRFNALKHGLTASQPLLPDEDGAELELLHESLFTELEPRGRLEELLVERVVQLSWRLQRMSRIEMGLFVHIFCEQVLSHEFAKADKRPGVTFNGRTRTTVVHRVEAEQREAILDSVTDPQAKARINRAREQMNDDMAVLGAAYRRDAQKSDAISKLLRYETTLEKSLFRALHELQRLQAARAGKDIQPPAVVDVNVTTN